MTRMLARQPFNLESKIGGRKSEVNNFRRKCELVATGDQVMVFVEAQMDLIRGLPYLALRKHDFDFLIVGLENSHCTRVCDQHL
jgi:hypothetical protein